MASKSHEIKLAPSMDIMAAENFKQELLRTINDDGTVILDVSEVERITTPCIQLLLASHLELKDHNNGLKIINASEALIDALTDVGLEKQYLEWSTPAQFLPLKH